MRLIQYNFTKINKIKYNKYNDVFQLIKSAFENLKNKNYEFTINDSTLGKELCEKLKVEAINENDEDSANLSFLLKMYFNLIISISNFWKLCEDLDYQNAWESLQDAISIDRTLKRFIDDDSQLSIDLIFNYLSQIEKLYPYSVFFSIEMIAKKVTCSICKKSPFDPECSHIAGDLYWGEMAADVIEEIEGLGVSLVKNPLDKSCRILIDYDKSKIETSPFRLIHFFVQNSKKPLKNFDLIETKRKLPRTYYNNLSEEAFCPCGSEKKFKECCFNKDFILNPHYKIIFKNEIILRF